MLRSAELLGAQRNELIDLDGEQPRLDVPLKRVKKRRVIQPLSSLAVEIINEGLEGQQQGFRIRQPARQQADAPQGDGRRAAWRQAQGQGEDARHLPVAGVGAIHATRSAADSGKLGAPDRSANGEDCALLGSSRETEDGVKLPPSPASTMSAPRIAM
jgi:hypothetical protein